MENSMFKNPSHKRLYGLLLMALSGVYIVLSNGLAQLLTTSNQDNIDSYGIVLIRGIFTTIISAIFLIIGRINPVPSIRIIISQIFLGTSVIIGILFMYLSLEIIPIGDATAIQASAPIFTTFLSIIFLRQKAHIMDFLCCGAGLIGLVIITRPTSIFGQQDNESKEICAKITGKKSKVALALNNADYALGVFFSILVAFLMAVFFILTKYLGKQTDFMVGMFYIGVTGVIIPLLKHVIQFVPPKLGDNVKDLSIGFFVSLFAFISIMFVSESLQLEDAGPASIVRYADFVYAFIFQYLFFRIEPTLLSIIGALVIVASTCSLTVYRHITAKKVSNNQ